MGSDSILATEIGAPPAHAHPEGRIWPLLWWPMLLLSIGVALYALAYVALGDRMYPPPLADSFRARPWGIYPHAFFGMIALAIGPFQFHRGLLVRRRQLHRRLGQVYLVSALIAGVAGLYMSLYSFGGFITHAGFGLLGAGLLLTSGAAWASILRRDIRRHREFTLRLWLPVLVAAFGGFPPAYLAVAWLCWVPNLVAAEAHIRFTRSRHPLRFLAVRPV